MQHKIISHSISVGAVALLGLIFTPTQASAFTFKSTLVGDSRTDVDLTMAAEITLTQEGVNDNQVRWIVNLLDQGDVVGEANVGFKEFGFNLRERIAKFVTLTPITPDDNWSFSGTGDQDQKLTGSGGLKFDYLFEADEKKFKSRDLEFLLTYDDGDASTLDRLFTADFTAAAFSTNSGGTLSGQAAGHVIGFDNVLLSDTSGIVAGEVPTPALLPGLVGICAAALRKRKGGSELEEA